MNRLVKRVLKVISFCAAFVLLFGCLSGCYRGDVNNGDIKTITVATNSPTASLEATPEPTPTFEENKQTIEAFDALDREVFCWYATSDGYAFHMFIAKPDSYGIDPTAVKMTLGEFTEEDSTRMCGEAAVYLERLKQLNREELPQEKQFSYDVLQQILEDLALDVKEYAYMYEPLTEYSGIHSNLPISFALFEFDNVQDVEDYLTLLADVPRYMGQVLAYEQKRAELGYFMTEDALEIVLEDCQAIIDSRETSFLYATFNDGIDALESLNDEQAQSYKDRNESLVRNEFIGAYQTLYHGMKALKKHCRTYEQAAALTSVEKAYFELSMQDAGSNRLSVEETLELLKDEVFYQLNQVIMLQYVNPDLPDMSIELTSGSTEADLEELKAITEKLLPPLPEHTLTLSSVPEELEDMTSPAFYVIPAMDEWTKNDVYINLGSESGTPILTLAHEAYPGHLFQHVYQHGLENVGLMQSAANFGGYAEGWAQFAEYLYAENQTSYDSDYVHFDMAYDMLVNSLLPALISIQVNYYGYTEEALESYLTGLGFDGSLLAPIFYPIVIDQPYYFFEYATGYCETIKLYRGAQEDLGERFDERAFIKAYLDLGPAGFNLIGEQMDIWIDELMNESSL